jgi:type VI secretion system protein ImpF
MRRSHSHTQTQQSKTESVPTPFRAYAHLMPTLFDRLRDDNPRSQTELAKDISVSPKELLRIVQRDLGYLLNTINAGNLFKEDLFPEAGVSTLNYGIPPLSGSYLLEKKRHRIEQIIRKAIITFEPRLLPESLSVTSLSKGDAMHHYNSLQFEIRGLVRADPHPIEFLVQSSVDLETNNFSLSTA